MLKNYLKITTRNILKHKGYSFINVTGLATGIACCLLIFIYVKGELTYDHFHSKKDRLYRVLSTINFMGNAFIVVRLAECLGDVILQVKAVQRTVFEQLEHELIAV